MQQESLQQGLFRRGAAMLCALALLSEGESYGYELVKGLENVSGGRFLMPEGTLYPILYRMEDKGYVNVRYEQIGRRMRRAYYSLTDEGREYYHSLLEEYRNVQEGIQLILEHAEQVEQAKQARTEK